MKFKALFYQNPVGALVALMLLVFSGGAFFIDRRVALGLIITFGVVLIIDIIYGILSLKSTFKYVSAVNNVLFGDSEESVDSFPMPSVMCDRVGNITWYNDQFLEDIIRNYDVDKLNIKDFFDDFDFEVYSKKSVVSAKFADREFTSFILNVESKSRPMLCMYFFDDTEYKAIEREYNFSRPFVMMLLIDNIEQLSRQLPDSRFAVVLGNIEGVIEDWLKDQNVVLKRIGNGNYGKREAVAKIYELSNLSRSVCGDSALVVSKGCSYNTALNSSDSGEYGRYNGSVRAGKLNEYSVIG